MDVSDLENSSSDIENVERLSDLDAAISDNGSVYLNCSDFENDPNSIACLSNEDCRKELSIGQQSLSNESSFTLHSHPAPNRPSSDHDTSLELNLNSSELHNESSDSSNSHSRTSHDGSSSHNSLSNDPDMFKLLNLNVDNDPSPLSSDFEPITIDTDFKDLEQFVSTQGLWIRKLHGIPTDQSCLYDAVMDQCKLLVMNWSGNPSQLKCDVMEYLNENGDKICEEDISKLISPDNWLDYLQTASWKDPKYPEHLVLIAITQILDRRLRVYSSKGAIVTLGAHSTNSTLCLGHVFRKHYVSLWSAETCPEQNKDKEYSFTSSEMSDESQYKQISLLQTQPEANQPSNTALLLKEPGWIQVLGDLAKCTDGYTHDIMRKKLTEIKSSAMKGQVDLEVIGNKKVMEFLRSLTERVKHRTDDSVVLVIKGYIGAAWVTRDNQTCLRETKALAKSLNEYKTTNSNILVGVIQCILFLFYLYKKKLGKAKDCLDKAIMAICNEEPSSWTSRVYYHEAKYYEMLAQNASAAPHNTSFTPEIVEIHKLPYKEQKSQIDVSSEDDMEQSTVSPYREKPVKGKKVAPRTRKTCVTSVSNNRKLQVAKYRNENLEKAFKAYEKAKGHCEYQLQNQRHKLSHVTNYEPIVYHLYMVHLKLGFPTTGTIATNCNYRTLYEYGSELSVGEKEVQEAETMMKTIKSDSKLLNKEDIYTATEWMCVASICLCVRKIQLQIKAYDYQNARETLKEAKEVYKNWEEVYKGYEASRFNRLDMLRNDLCDLVKDLESKMLFQTSPTNILDCPVEHRQVSTPVSDVSDSNMSQLSYPGTDPETDP